MFKKVTVSLISLCLLFTILGAGNYNQENYDTNNQKNVLSNLLVFKSNVAKAKRSGPIGKANKKKQGREVSEKKRTSKNWRSKSNKNPNRPMKKHTPSKKHKGGK